MRRAVSVVCVLAVAAGCGRWGFEDRHQDPDSAPALDAALDASIDAAVDASMIDALVNLQTLTIPSDGSVILSMPLQAGRIYTLVASGTFTEVPPAQDPLGDAEYYNLTGSDGPKDGGGSAGSVDVGLGIDDPTVDETKTPKWGPYRPDHIYTIQYTGTGSPLQAQIQDCCNEDNSGSLTLEVFE